MALLAEDVAVAALEDVAAGDAHAHRTLEVLPHILHQAIHCGLSLKIQSGSFTSFQPLFSFKPLTDFELGMVDAERARALAADHRSHALVRSNQVEVA